MGVGRLEGGFDRLEELGDRYRGESGEGSPPGNGVVVSTSWPGTFDHRMALACAIIGGVVRFPTAGMVWGLRRTPRSRDIHRWIEHRLVQRDDGISITSPPRTAFDASDTLEPDDLESLVEHGIDLGNFIMPTLRAIATRAVSGLCHDARGYTACIVT